jgi:hypothetical protein
MGYIGFQLRHAFGCQAEPDYFAVGVIAAVVVADSLSGQEFGVLSVSLRRGVLSVTQSRHGFRESTSHA